MSTNYPNSIDNFTNPTSTDSLSSTTVPHHQQHADVNDAVEAIQGELGVNPSGPYNTVKARIEGLESDILNQSVLNGLFDVTIGTASNGDLLQYNGSAWINSAKENLVDGGSF
jgi:hypothetical protein